MLPVSMRPAPFSVVEEGWPLSEQIAKTAALRIECRECRHKNALHCQVSLNVAGWFSFSYHTLCLGSRVCCLLGVNSSTIAGVQQLLGKRNSGNVTVHYTNSKNGYTKWFTIYAVGYINDYDYIMAPQRGRPYGGANLGSMGRNTGTWSIINILS